MSSDELRFMIEATGVRRQKEAFWMALERGETHGDVVAVGGIYEATPLFPEIVQVADQDVRIARPAWAAEFETTTGATADIRIASLA